MCEVCRQLGIRRLAKFCIRTELGELQSVCWHHYHEIANSIRDGEDPQLDLPFEEI